MPSNDVTLYAQWKKSASDIVIVLPKTGFSNTLTLISLLMAGIGSTFLLLNNQRRKI